MSEIVDLDAVAVDSSLIRRGCGVVTSRADHTSLGFHFRLLNNKALRTFTAECPLSDEASDAHIEGPQRVGAALTRSETSEVFDGHRESDVTHERQRLKNVLENVPGMASVPALCSLTATPV